jgi:hypothetical protein
MPYADPPPELREALKNYQDATGALRLLGCQVVGVVIKALDADRSFVRTFIAVDDAPDLPREAVMAGMIRQLAQHAGPEPEEDGEVHRYVRVHKKI